MENIRQIIAKNIADLRKKSGMTQAELAEKLNYTDKAISKWERGESTPDVESLYTISKIFGVTVDALFTENVNENIKDYTLPKKDFARRCVILALYFTTVIFIALVIFVYSILNNIANASKMWVAFIYPIPICAFIAIIFFKRLSSRPRFSLTITSSILNWGAVTTVYLQALVLGKNWWLIFLIGIPIQIAILLSSYLKSN